MTNFPLVSVIIPTYNRAPLISTAIRCCLNQTYPNKQIIVIDDGSTDATEDVVRTFPNVIYIKKENGGVASARNRGLDACQGEYIAFLDADDELSTDCFQKGIDLLCEGAYDFAAPQKYCEKIVAEDGNFELIYKSREPYPSNRDEMQNLLLRHFVGSTAMIAKAKCFSEIRYDTTLQCAEDLDLWLHLIQKGFKAGLIPSNNPLYFYRIHAGSLTTTQNAKSVFYRWKSLYSVFHRYEASSVKNNPKSREIFADKYWRIGRNIISNRYRMMLGIQLLIRSQMLKPSWERLTSRRLSRP